MTIGRVVHLEGRYFFFHCYVIKKKMSGLKDKSVDKFLLVKICKQ